VNFEAFWIPYKNNDIVLYRPTRFFACYDVTFEIYEFNDIAIMLFLSSQECIFESLFPSFKFLPYQFSLSYAAYPSRKVRQRDLD
jgi:hypothetical protein